MTSVPVIPRAVIANAQDIGGGFSVSPDVAHQNSWWVHLPDGSKAGPYWDRSSAFEAARQRRMQAGGKL